MISTFKQWYNQNNPYKFMFIVYGITFILLLIKGPMIGHDSHSYMGVEISRFPGFVICVRIFKFLFQGYFGYFLIAFHLLLGFSAIHYTIKSFNKIIPLNFLLNILFFGTLLSPYFQSIYAANNVTSEGITYAFYLFFISSSVLLIFLNDRKKLVWIGASFVLLTLTRGQFIVDSLITATIYGLKHYKQFKTKPVLVVLSVLIVLPIISSSLDKSYRKLLFGHYVSTPYSYINAVALPLYVSKKEDINLLKEQDTKNIFEFSYNRVDSLGFLNSIAQKAPYYTGHFWRYMRFHRNFPRICNQNVHTGGVNYFLEKGYTSPESYIKTEEACKAMMIPLIKANFKQYIIMYLTSIMYGFNSIPLAILIVILAIYSGLKCLTAFNTTWGLTFLITLLVISNAMIVAVACHSIYRYFFYNTFLLFILVIIHLNNLKPSNQ